MMPRVKSNYEQVTKTSKIMNEELVLMRIHGKPVKLLNFEILDFGFPAIGKETKIVLKETRYFNSSYLCHL